MDSLEAALIAHIPHSKLMVIAIRDTNARCGSTQSCGIAWVCLDPLLKDRRPQFIKLLKEHSMSIINGSVGKDLKDGGKFTCFVKDSKTTIDHTFASQSAVSRILDFEVLEELNLISDHAPLLLVVETDLTVKEEIEKKGRLLIGLQRSQIG